MTTADITPNAVSQLVQSGEGKLPSGVTPILQVINLKTVRAPSGDRYRMVLSDGTYFVQGMLATQLNHLVQSQQITADTLIRADELMNNLVQGRNVIIILKATVMGNPGYRIGTPTDVEKSGIKGGSGGGGTAGATAVGGSASAAVQPLYNSTNVAAPSGTGMNPNSRTTVVKPSPPRSSNPYGGGGGAATAATPYGATSSLHTSHAPIVRSNAVAGGVVVTPIAGLNMYNNRWTIQARVTSKSEIRTWSNAKGEGSLFSVELLDASGTDIRATFFREAVDKFYNFLMVGQVYTFSGGRLKVANLQYNNCKSNLEITFDQNSEIHLDQSGAAAIANQMYDLVKIAELENVAAEKMVDIIGVVVSVSDVATITSKKSGRELFKCDLTVLDDSEAQVTVTLWGQTAQKAPTDYAGNPVVAFRKARVSDYNGKSLSAGSGIDIRPEIPQARQLEQWWRAGGTAAASNARSLSATAGGGAGASGKPEPLSKRQSIADIKQQNLGHDISGKADYVSFKANVTFLKKDKEGGAWYPACFNAGEPCKNRYKVSQTTDGQWYCDKCQGTYPNCVRRWIFSAVLEDATSSTWVSFFNEQAEQLLACTADEAYAKTFAMDHDQDAYDSFFARSLNTEWVFRCKVKNEVINEESRVKTSVYSLHPVDYLQESKDMLSALEAF